MIFNELFNESPRHERTPGIPGVFGVLRSARYWDRTSDLFRVREARYRCANRACSGYSVEKSEVATGFEPV